MIYMLMGYAHAALARRLEAIRTLERGERGQGDGRRAGTGDGRVRRPDPARIAAEGGNGRGDERVQ